MDWVKLESDYYRSLGVALGDDALEVMFTRGLALAGELEKSGFIPDAMLHTLTRRPQKARHTARQLIAADAWEKVLGGYQIVNWAEYQAELERLVERKRRDKERKRKARTEGRESVPASVDASADSPAPRPVDSLLDHQSGELDAAAAASREPFELPGELLVLRSKLDAAHLVVRWDKLAPDQVEAITNLVHRHGDWRLVEAAGRTWRRDNPPVFAQAWLGTWEALPEPGQRLALMDACPEPGHNGTTRRCAECASEALEAGAK